MNDFIRQVVIMISSFPLWAILMFLFLSACIQQFFPPYPSEILLLFMGCLSAGKIVPGAPVFAAYAIGTALSSLLLFYIARQNGKPLLKQKWVRRLFSKRNQRKAGIYVRKYGAAALLFGKLLPGVGTLSLILGGILGLKGLKTWLTVGLSGVFFNFIYFFAGREIGVNLNYVEVFLKEFSFFAIVTAISLFIMFILIISRRSFRRIK